MPKLSGFSVNLDILLVGRIEGTWVPDENEKKAAWELYVELITRISIAELKPGEVLLREALSSLHSLFDTTRIILRKYGPNIAQKKGDGDLSFGYLAVVILNLVLRPTLAKWHPLLLSYENSRKASVSSLDHERQWDKYEYLRFDLNVVRRSLIDYANLLAQVAETPSLIIEISNE